MDSLLIFKWQNRRDWTARAKFLRDTKRHLIVSFALFRFTKTNDNYAFFSNTLFIYRRLIGFDLCLRKRKKSLFGTFSSILLLCMSKVYFSTFYVFSRCNQENVKFLVYSSFGFCLRLFAIVSCVSINQYWNTDSSMLEKVNRITVSLYQICRKSGIRVAGTGDVHINYAMVFECEWNGKMMKLNQIFFHFCYWMYRSFIRFIYFFLFFCISKTNLLPKNELDAFISNISDQFSFTFFFFFHLRLF